MTGDTPAGEPVAPQKQSAIETLFTGLPDSAGERYAALLDIRKSFYAELARQFQPVLNNYARAQPLLTDDDWSKVATSVSHMLRHLGLALVSPRDNLPSMLVFDTTRRGERNVRRFRFAPIGRHATPYTCYELPDLELCQAPTRSEAFSHRFKTSGQDRSELER